MQKIAEQIAKALHDLEAAIDKSPATPAKKRIEARARTLHRHLEKLARDYGPGAGVDIAPLSGGGVKPN